MNVQIDLPDCTLSTENQAVVDAINKFLALLPDDADHKAALRLAMVILKAADVAPQADLAWLTPATMRRQEMTAFLRETWRQNPILQRVARAQRMSGQAQQGELIRILERGSNAKLT